MRMFRKNLFALVAFDALLLAFAWYSANLLRFNFVSPEGVLPLLFRVLPILLIVKIVAFYFFDLYRGMWRYASLNDLWNVIKASTLSSLALVSLIQFTHGFQGMARSVFVIDWLLTLFLISGSRIAIRLYFWLFKGDPSTRFTWKGFFLSIGKKNARTKRLLIIGAGDYGEKIYREIRDNARLEYQVVGFIDDDPAKANMRIHGISVIGTTDEIKEVSDQLKADELLIAIASASSQQMREIIRKCEGSGLPFKTVPGMGELIDGRVTVKAIRDVAYADLLGREPVKLEDERIGRYIQGKAVLITGAGGSIGSELCRQVCRFSPERLILYERAETPLFEIDLELREHYPTVRIVSVLGDILDRNKLTRTFQEQRPNVVFHAAAYKHVPMMEFHPWDAVVNNIFGTSSVIECARECGSERFVLVSTDKAVKPVNVMGATKRVAELLVQGQNGCGQRDTRFLTVRFGNVVGSAGSVVTLFQRQIERGGPVTVTHPEITRYFMTIPEACQLILQAGSMGEGGEIFILDMGSPIRIAEMARDLIRLSGFEPEEDIPIQYIGLRPGEKLYEELITEGEGIVPTDHEKILVLQGTPCNVDLLNRKIEELMTRARNHDATGIRAVLQEIVPDYRPFETVTSDEKQVTNNN